MSNLTIEYRDSLYQAIEWHEKVNYDLILVGYQVIKRHYTIIGGKSIHDDNNIPPYTVFCKLEGAGQEQKERAEFIAHCLNLKGKWKPIKSAPKDETIILVKWLGRIQEAWFNLEVNNWQEWPDGDFDNGGEVTHWMHRPFTTNQFGKTDV